MNRSAFHRFRRAMGIVVGGVAVLVSGCATAPAIDDLTGMAPVAPRADLLDDSVLDFDELGPYTDAEKTLVDLLVPPPAVPDRHRLVQLVVDDPNGDGRVGEFWYPPRVLERNCSISLDQAPAPTVSGIYVVGDPQTPPGDGFGALGALADAPSNLGISIIVLDTEQQRDELLEPLLTTTAGIGGLECDFGQQFDELGEILGADGDDLPPLPGEFGAMFDSMFPDVDEFEPYDAGVPGWGFSFDGLLVTGETVVYAVGDRVILTLANVRTGIATISGEATELSLDPREFAEVAQRQVDRLVDRGFG